MKTLILRLDDACPKMDVDRWAKMEALCDQYHVKPLVGIIPDCKDPDMDVYAYNDAFWTETIQRWKAKDWVLALHGYQHIFITREGGINAVNSRSEFAGISPDVQKEKIKNGICILRSHGIDPKVFYAPAHTFDHNTLIALKEETDIRIISDTIAWDRYQKNDFTFVPQQCGKVRNLPFKTVTFCYHPNIMHDDDFSRLEDFLKENAFGTFPCDATKRKYSFIDRILKYLYLKKHKNN